jgi:hypothetical protein
LDGITAQDRHPFSLGAWKVVNEFAWPLRRGELGVDVQNGRAVVYGEKGEQCVT